MKPQYNKKFLEGPIVRSLLALAIPIVFSNVLQAGYQLIDAFWVGRLGGDAVAAVAVSFPVMFLSMALGMGLAIAGSTLIAQYVGAGNHEQVNHIGAQTLVMIVAVSIILGVIGYLGSPYFLRLMGVAPAVYNGALGFMRVSFIGLVFNFSFFMFQSIMRGVGEVKMPVYIVMGTVALNFLLDPLFIFGYGPIPATGVMGAALATLGTQSLAAIIGVVILMRGRHGVTLHVRDLRPDWEYVARAFKLGFPASVEMSTRALSLMVLTFLITGFGTLSVAAFGVGSNILQVIIIPAMGLSMAVSTLVGQNIGAGQIDRAGRIGRLGAIIGFSVLSVLGIIAYFTAESLVAFFVPKDPLVIAAGGKLIRIMSLSWGLMGILFSFTGVFRAAGNMVLTMVLTLISQWVLQFPLAYILSQHTSMGILGIWWSFPITNIVMGVISVVLYARGDWKKKRLISQDERLIEKMSEEIILEDGIRN